MRALARDCPHAWRDQAGTRRDPSGQLNCGDHFPLDQYRSAVSEEARLGHRRSLVAAAVRRR